MSEISINRFQKWRTDRKSRNASRHGKKIIKYLNLCIFQFVAHRRFCIFPPFPNLGSAIRVGTCFPPLGASFRSLVNFGKLRIPERHSCSPSPASSSASSASYFSNASLQTSSPIQDPIALLTSSGMSDSASYS